MCAWKDVHQKKLKDCEILEQRMDVGQESLDSMERIVDNVGQEQDLSYYSLKEKLLLGWSKTELEPKCNLQQENGPVEYLRENHKLR